MRTRSLLVVSTALLLVVALIASLGLWVRLFTPVLSFDIAADRTRALPAGYAERSPYPFGEFARYEITVHYVLVRMYNPVLGGHSRHLLLNRPPGQGVRNGDGERKPHRV